MVGQNSNNNSAYNSRNLPEVKLAEAENQNPQNLAESLFAQSGAKTAHDTLAENLFSESGATLPTDTESDELALQKNLFSKALGETGSKGLQVDKDKEQARKIHARFTELTEEDKKVVVILNNSQVKDAQELNELQQQFVAMAQQKNMAKSVRPKIVEARVVIPGERKYVFDDLMSLARKKIEMFTDQPFAMTQKRKARRGEGLVADPEQDKEEQMKMQNERSAHLGG